MGDKILAGIEGISCCCLFWVSALFSAAGFGVAFAEPIRDELKANLSSEIAKELVKPEIGMWLGISALVAIVLGSTLIVGLWRSTRWALWVTFALHLPGVVFIFWGDIAGSMPSILICLYTGFRLSGALGPKP